MNSAILENKVPLSHPPRAIDGVKLTGEEYSQFVELAGKPAKEALNKIVNGPGFDNLSGGPDGMKSEIIRNIVQQFRSAARQRMIMLNPSLRSRILDKQQERAGALSAQ